MRVQVRHCRLSWGGRRSAKTGLAPGASKRKLSQLSKRVRMRTSFGSLRDRSITSN